MTLPSEPLPRAASDTGVPREKSRLARRFRPDWRRPRTWLFSALGLAFLAWLWALLSYPSDHTPEGAYLRVVRAVTMGSPQDFFAYTEEDAQHACYSIGRYRKQLLERARSSYPKPLLAELEEKYGALAAREDGPEVFAWYAAQQAWLDQLRRDLSGVERVEIAGPRATVVTVKGTRYAFRLRPGGIWGLSAFTPLLSEEAERAARDFALVDRAAADYEHAAKQRPKGGG